MVPQLRKLDLPVRVAGPVALKRLPSRKPRQLFAGNEEPRLGEIMNDPILRCLLASDNVPINSLENLVADLRNRLDRRRMLS